MSEVRRRRPSGDAVGRARRAPRTDGTSGVSWVADPLDGTTQLSFCRCPHIQRLPRRSATTARPVVGVVVDLSRGTDMVGGRGRSALVQRRGCHVADGRSELGHRPGRDGLQLAAERRPCRARKWPTCCCAPGHNRIGSAALDLCWVADCRFDAYFVGLHYWDWAAGSAICVPKPGAELVTFARRHRAGQARPS